MKLTIKTLRQETFELEARDTDTVLLIKNKIEKISQHDMPANRMTLIYAGLILDNDKIIKSYNISANKFIVAMVKPLTSKVATKSTTDEQTSTNKLNKSTTNISKDAEEGVNAAVRTTVNTTVKIPSNNIATSTNIQPTATTVTNIIASSESLINAEQINTSIRHIIDVTGYPENEVRRAFEASFNNPDRAVEYLINGLPTNSIQTLGIDMEAIQRSMIESRALNRNNLSTSSPLEFLRTDPTFHHMRLVLRENPDLLETVILHIAETNPTLLNLIVQHQEDFVNIINEPIDGIDNDNDNVSEHDIIDNEEDDSYEAVDISADANDEQSSLRIYMTPEDLEAVTRLTCLGFSEILCVEAYFACDKNEEQAANLLCSNQMEE